ncbi:MAG TPA: thioredoxin [Candidatus Scatavimonas merdigallinarum]|uniref:Thioredoxin n=1 Tax=Candidatus Scatavimonas merdigallinarum TaxID=2840914 RepID=A0A9D0ZFP4_9FIRM|nr:thioredoxin [Candidatus Scatavimonas merdigallinarum]
MAETILHPTKDNFDTMLQENKVVLVDFWADWCGPCKMLAPVIDSLAKEYNGRAAFAKINVDEQSDLATRFGIMSIPTVIIFKNGQEIAKEIGFKPADSYRGILENAL